MSDLYQFQKTVLDSPAANGAAIVPSDSADLPVTSRCLYVGTAGDVTCELTGAQPGVTVLLSGMAAGIIHPIRVRKVWATGTTASNMVSLY